MQRRSQKCGPPIRSTFAWGNSADLPLPTPQDYAFHVPGSSVYLAALVDHSGRLAAGETGFVLVLAATRSQAKGVFQYRRAFIVQSATLRQLVEEMTAEEIRLRNGIVIAVHSTSFRSISGRSSIGAIFDECAYWRDALSAMPDVETYRAVLPALSTTSGMLIGISSPYGQRGLRFTRHRDYYGQDDADVLVVKVVAPVQSDT